MKIKYTIFITILLLFGCSEQPNNIDDNHGYGWEYDYITPQGIKIRDSSVFNPSIDAIDFYYLKVKNCMEMDIDLNNIIIFQDGVLKDTPDFGAITYFDTLLIVMDTSNSHDQRIYQTIRHEFVHAFLAVTDFDPALNSNHKSPYFASCLI